MSEAHIYHSSKVFFPSEIKIHIIIGIKNQNGTCMYTSKKENLGSTENCIINIMEIVSLQCWENNNLQNSAKFYKFPSYYQF